MPTQPKPKSPAQLDREITAAMRATNPGLAAILKKWRAGIAAYKRELDKLEAGGDDWERAAKARNKLDDISWEACGHAPGGHHDPVIAELASEREALPGIALARERGQAVRVSVREAEARKLRDEEREYQRSRPR